jgi:hypothetical protein
MISLSHQVSGGDIAQALEDDPEEIGYLLQGLAWSLGKAAREELGRHLQSELGATDRKAVRDLALMIAGACGEAE